MNKLAANIIFAEFMGMELITPPDYSHLCNPTPTTLQGGRTLTGNNTFFSDTPPALIKMWKGEWYTNKLLKENVAPLASGPMAPCIATEDLKFTDDWTWFIPVWTKYQLKMNEMISDVQKGNVKSIESEKQLIDLQETLEQDKRNIHDSIDQDTIERAYLYLFMQLLEMHFFLTLKYIL